MFPQATSFLEHKVVLKLGSHRIFFLTEVLLFHNDTGSPIVGASDMSQVCTYVLSKTKVKTYAQMGHKNTLQIEGIL